jgi:hypothetical protein
MPTVYSKGGRFALARCVGLAITICYLLGNVIVTVFLIFTGLAQFDSSIRLHGHYDGMGTSDCNIPTNIRRILF